LTTKEWFMRVRRSDRRIDSLLQRKQEEWERVTSITANLSGDVVDGTKDPHKYDGYVALIRQIDEETDELYKAKQEVNSVIKQIPDIRYRDVLDKRYLGGKTWEQIAVEMHYSYMHICRLHGEALKAAEEYITDDKSV